MTENQLVNAAVDNDTRPASVPPAQAARRLVALGLGATGANPAIRIPAAPLARVISVAATPQIAATPTAPAVKGTPASGWRVYSDPDINPFWTALIARSSSSYLILLLQGHNTALVTALTTIITTTQSSSSTYPSPLGPPPFKTVNDLAAASDPSWTTFFNNDASLLPSVTLPGSVSQQITAFIQRLRKYVPGPAPQSSTTTANKISLSASKMLSLTSSGNGSSSSSQSTSVYPPPSFGVPENDALSLFLTQFPSANFGQPLDQSELENALVADIQHGVPAGKPDSCASSVDRSSNRQRAPC